jgi:hypothetical protein
LVVDEVVELVVDEVVESFVYVFDILWLNKF